MTPGANGTSRFSRLEFSTHAQVLRLRHVQTIPHHDGIAGVAFPTYMTRSAHENTDFGALLAGLRFPLHGRSARRCYRGRTSAGGRSGRLNLPRKKLSFSIPNRFYSGTP